MTYGTPSPGLEQA